MGQTPYGAGVAVAGAIALWSCGGSGASSPTSPTPTANPAPGATIVTSTIVGSTGNQAFNPNPIRAGAGDTVTFRNSDSQLHHIVLDNGVADLGELAPGATSRGFTLSNTNEVRFHCLLHSSMVGSINGSTAPEPPPCEDPLGYGC